MNRRPQTQMWRSGQIPLFLSKWHHVSSDYPMLHFSTPPSLPRQVFSLVPRCWEGPHPPVLPLTQHAQLWVTRSRWLPWETHTSFQSAPSFRLLGCCSTFTWSWRIVWDWEAPRPALGMLVTPLGLTLPGVLLPLVFRILCFCLLNDLTKDYILIVFSKNFSLHFISEASFPQTIQFQD